MDNNIYKRLVALAIWVPGQLLLAQTRPDALTEVIVTAQKRTENLQVVPASLTVFQSSMLERARITSLDDAAARTPGFSMGHYNLGEPRFFIRGVGSVSDSAAGDPTVGVFQDEVYVGRVSGASYELLDMERVEILKGPQNTLYGRNTAGGAINIVPKLASRTPELSVQGEYGNYSRVAIQSMVNGPIGEHSAARLAVGHRLHSGYSSNILTGAELDDENTTSLRLSLSSDLSDASRLRLSLDRVRDRNGGNARVPGPVFSDQTGTNAIAYAALARLWPAGSDVRRAYADGDSYQHRDIVGLMSRLDTDADYGTWTLLASWRDVDLDWFEDLDSLKPFGNPPLPSIPSSTYGWVISSKDRAREEAHQYSVEARLTAPASASLKWMLGANYFAENVDRIESFVTRFSLIPAASGDVAFMQNARNHSLAIYGQASYPITEPLSITAGLRYNQDKKDIRQVARNNDPADPTPGIPLFPGQPYDIKASHDWNSFTGKLSAEYMVAAGKFLYLSANRGFKSGIFPSQNNVVQNVGVATPAEKVMSYEAGAKTDWLAQRLRINASVFKMVYDDLQMFRLDPQLRLITFTENARIEGLETEVASVPITGLQVGLTYAYLKARVKGGVNDGNTLPHAPDHKVGTYVEHRWLVARGDVTGRIEYTWTDDTRIEVPNARETLIPSYGLLDAAFGYRLSDSRIELSMWGKNLSDQLYATHTTPFLGNGFSIYGPPRTYGISVKWQMP